MTQKINKLVVVTGPTATGKTNFAAHLANRIGGEVISADSRQVYRGMDLATGKDLDDYIVGGKRVPYHLVDILEPGYEYNVFEFQQDFIRISMQILEKGSVPVLCGGTGLYIESVLKGYKLIQVPDNDDLRAGLGKKSMDQLIRILESYKMPHNTTDIKDRKRLTRAIEIQDYYKTHPELDTSFPDVQSVVFGVQFERQYIRERITSRLKVRLEKGMIEEVKVLLDSGLSAEQLKFYGLEYRYLTQYVIGELTYDEMFRLLNTAIHQFAKRQMTWFRKMERNGQKIHWIEGTLPMEEKLNSAMRILEKK